MSAPVQSSFRPETQPVEVYLLVAHAKQALDNDDTERASDLLELTLRRIEHLS